MRCALDGQSTVEGAFLIPVILLMLLLLIQPGILLYDRMVMQAAASEGCRLIATRPAGDSLDAYKAFVLRRLGSVPRQDNFHVHEGGCTWVVEFAGDENSNEVRVDIENQVKPLPFFDFAAKALGVLNESGNYFQKVSVSASTKSAWVSSSGEGSSPQEWVRQNGSTYQRDE